MSRSHSSSRLRLGRVAHQVAQRDDQRRLGVQPRHAVVDGGEPAQRAQVVLGLGLRDVPRQDLALAGAQRHVGDAWIGSCRRGRTRPPARPCRRTSASPAGSPRPRRARCRGGSWPGSRWTARRSPGSSRGA